MKHFHLSLRKRLLLLVLLAVAPACVLLAYSTWEDRKLAQAEAQRQTRQVATLVVEEQNRIVNQTRQLLAVLASLTVVQKAGQDSECGETLARIRENYPAYGNLGVVDAKGNMLCSALPFKSGLKVADRAWFARASENRGFAVGDYLIGRISGLPSLTLAFPVLDADGGFEKIVFAAIDLAWLQDLVGNLALPPNTATVIVDANGIVLARHPDLKREWMGKPAPESGALAGITAGGCQGYAELAGQDKVLRLYAIEPLQRLDGRCVHVRVGVPKAEIEGPIDRRFGRNLGAMALVSLLALAAAWFGGDLFVLRPVRALARAARRLGRGDLASRTDIPYAADELGQLARCFDEMAAGVEERETRIVEAGRALTRANRALNLLSAGNRAMLRARDEQSLLDDMCRMIVDKGGYRMAWVGYCEGTSTRSVKPVAHAGSDSDYIGDLHIPGADDPAGVVAAAVRGHGPIVARNIPGDPYHACGEEAWRRGCAAWIVLPLNSGLEQGSILSIYSDEADAFDPTEIELLQEAAADLSFGIAKLRDQTRRREAEETSRIKSEFLANMSHELRTPLNAIIGFSEVLKDGLLGEMPQRQREYVADIFTSGHHLLSLINDILDLSKVEAGKMSFELESVEVQAILQSSLAIVREKAGAHQIAVACELTPGLDALELDQRKTKQIIFNLLSNAIKFTPDGGRVTLRARRVGRGEIENWSAQFGNAMRLPLPANEFAQFLEISVEDTGIGIKPEDAPRLFQPFSQLDSSLARRFEGTGLGLTMVMKMAQLHGGTVAVASQPGVGSRFTVWLPWRHPQAPALATGREAPPQVVQSGLALVVEDDDAAAELARLQLETEGLQSLRAKTAEAALELLGACHPFVIVLDILLPGMDGWDFLARIKESGSPWADVPVVIGSIVADAQKGFSLGAAQVLQKPVSREDLRTALYRLGLHPPVRAQTRVLVVDDDPRAVELIAAYLNVPGYSVLRAYGGREGIAMAHAERPDLLVLDLLMPEVSGFEVVAAMQADAGTAGIPIVVVTAKELTQGDHDQLNGYVRAILTKAAFDHGRFIAEVRRALAGGWQGARP